jgi:hypothetical protein
MGQGVLESHFHARQPSKGYQIILTPLAMEQVCVFVRVYAFKEQWE